MAHFYGKMQGSRGQVSRLGTKSSGISLTGASWEGAVHIALWHDQATDSDMVDIKFSPWHGRGISKSIYRGPINGSEIKRGKE